MSGPSKAEELSPRPLMRMLGDFANSQILDASIEYDFFKAEGGPVKLRKLRRLRGENGDMCDPWHVSILLNSYLSNVQQNNFNKIYSAKAQRRKVTLRVISTEGRNLS